MEYIYVMFCFSHTVGGGQSYVNTKVRWLKNNGWKVIVFSTVESLLQGKSPWDALTEYEEYSCLMLNTPPEFCGEYLTKQTLNWMQSVIGEHKKVVIESHTDFFAEWGELLAARIRAKHICFLLDEQLDKYPNKEFLYYKYLRNEVAGIHKTSMKRLFDGYKEVEESTRYVLRAAHENNVRDILVESVNNLVNEKYNIAYIGRYKQYCNNIKQGITKFAYKHPDDSIQLVILGDIGDTQLFSNVENIKVTQLGFMNPIPMSFFNHIDVVIAGAGCARIAAEQGVYTIVADAHTCMASGVLGYTTEETLFSKTSSLYYEDILDDILITHQYDNRQCSITKATDINEAFEEHFAFIEKSNKSVDYFDFDSNPQPIAVLGKRNHLKKCIMNIFPRMIWLSFSIRRIWGKLHEIKRDDC